MVITPNAEIMHELSIVMNIIDTAKSELEKVQLSFVDSIELEIGSLAGVELEALDFAWQLSVPGTVLENAKRKIHRIHATARCRGCKRMFQIETYYEQCPNCNDFYSDIISGKEMRIKSIVAG